MRFDFLYNFCLKHFSVLEELSEIWPKMCIGLHVKHSLFLSEFNETWIFSTDLRRIFKCQIFLKIRAVGAESLHAVAPKNRQKLNYWYRYVSVLISSDDRRNQHKTDLNFFKLISHDGSVERIRSFLFVPTSHTAIVATVHPFNLH